MTWPPRTLTRRLVLTLLAALAGVAVLLTAYNVWDIKQASEAAGARPLAQVMLRMLDSIPDPDIASQALASFVRQMNHERQQLSLPVPPLALRLWDVQGRLWLDLPRSPPQASAPAMRIEVSSARWRLEVQEALPDDMALLRWQATELLEQILMALPLLALPLWLAVRSGLKPLRRFAAQVSGMDPRGPLQPLGQDLRYAELAPVGRAFDALIGRLDERMAIERAFVQDAAHELRTPLAALAAQVHLLLEAGDARDRQASAAELLATLQRTAHLSQQLLDLALLDRGDRPAEALDLAELGAELLASLHAQARARGQQLALTGPEQLPWHGDRAALVHVLQNLLDNALRYTPDGGRIELRLSAAPPRLAVLDDGPGIPEAERERVFDRFWRSPDQAQPGTGLGLAIAAQAAQRLGGRLRLAPGLRGRGVGFELTLLERRGV